ncbi:MAG: hypothetical protein JNL33_13450 [Betaproteobacteria bacterium]|nr:hypothetical protein [Betaproteobacteria bacterium]
MNRIRIGVVRAGGEARGKGIVGTLLTVILGAVAIVGAVLFSVVILAVALVVGAVLVGYFWWRTRHVRKQLREHMARQQAAQAAAAAGSAESPHPDGKAPAQAGGTVIEGEFVREPER